MKKIKYIFLINSIILLFYSFEKPVLTIGEIWRNFHVNSLIGLQKVIESSYIQLKIEINIWITFFLPILQLPALITFAIIMLIIFILCTAKYKL